jgi:hypothetical protein
MDKKVEPDGGAQRPADASVTGAMTKAGRKGKTKSKGKAGAARTDAKTPTAPANAKVPADAKEKEIRRAAPAADSWKDLREKSAKAGRHARVFVVVSDFAHGERERTALCPTIIKGFVAVAEKQKRPGVNGVNVFLVSGDDIEDALAVLGAGIPDLGMILVSPFAPNRDKTIATLQAKGWLASAPGDGFVLCDLYNICSGQCGGICSRHSKPATVSSRT